MRVAFLFALVFTGVTRTSPALASDAPQPSESPHGLDPDMIVARVNGAPIFDQELKQACYFELRHTEHLSESERSSEQRRIVRRELDRLIERELILHEARVRLKKEPGALAVLEAMAASNCEKQIQNYEDRLSAFGVPCDTHEQFAELLKSQGMTLDSLQRQSERGFIALEYMRRRIGPAAPATLERKYRQIVVRLRKPANIEILWPDYDKSVEDAAAAPPSGHWRVKINITSPPPRSSPP